MDFLMFNYDPTPYFKISRKDKWLEEKSLIKLRFYEKDTKFEKHVPYKNMYSKNM